MSDKRTNVLAALSGIARRLARRRALEAAALAAAAAGLCAAGLELAWTIAALHPRWAVGICAAVGCVGPGGLAFRAVRRRLGVTRGQAAWAGALFAACGAIGLWAVMAGWHAAVPKAVLPAVLLPGAAIAAAAAVTVRGVSLREAAILVDARCGLAERLATAEELARSAAPDAPAPRCVYRQALTALEETAGEQLPLWRRGRATAGTVALVTLLCVTLAALPTLGLEARLVGALEQMTPEARRKLAESLRKAAREAGSDTTTADQLRQAARAVEIKDKDALEKIRQALAKRGMRLVEVVGRDALAAAIASAKGAGGGGDAAAHKPNGRKTSDRAANGTTTRPAPDRTAGPSVYVGNPDYARMLAARGADTAPASAKPPADSFIRLDDAWRGARRRARTALAARKVPPPYRQLVRDFFAGE